MKYEFKLNGTNEPREIYVTSSSLRGDHRANRIPKFQFTGEAPLYSVRLTLPNWNKQVSTKTYGFDFFLNFSNKKYHIEKFKVKFH